jgi:hypothetical protein
MVMDVIEIGQQKNFDGERNSERETAVVANGNDASDLD